MELEQSHQSQFYVATTDMPRMLPIIKFKRQFTLWWKLTCLNIMKAHSKNMIGHICFLFIPRHKAYYSIGPRFLNTFYTNPITLFLQTDWVFNFLKTLPPHLGSYLTQKYTQVIKMRKGGNKKEKSQEKRDFKGGKKNCEKKKKEKKVIHLSKSWGQGGGPREKFILGTWFCSPNSCDLRVVCQPPVFLLPSVEFALWCRIP